MSSESLQAALKDIEQEISEMQARLRDLTFAARAVRRILNGSAPPEQPSIRLGVVRRAERPATVEAIREVLQERVNRPLTVTNIHYALRTKGLLAPDLKQPMNTILEAAKRLASRDPEVHRTKRGGRVAFIYRPADVESRVLVPPPSGEPERGEQAKDRD